MSSEGESLGKNQGDVGVFAAANKRRSQNLFFLLGYFVFVLFAYCVVSIIPPVQAILVKKEQVMAAQLEGVKKIPDIEKNIERIEKQMTILNSDSVGARLDKLENLVGAGKMNVDQVRTLAQLNSELAVVKGYMFKDPTSLFELKELQSNYQKLVLEQSSYASKDSLNSQITNLQWVFGLAMGFFGLLFTVVFGSWWFVGNRANSEPLPTRPVRDGSSSPASSDGEVSQ